MRVGISKIVPWSFASDKRQCSHGYGYGEIEAARLSDDKARFGHHTYSRLFHIQNGQVNRRIPKTKVEQCMSTDLLQIITFH
jgi:hypothetical protein